jgi:predicted dehydrogenase
MKPRTSSRKMRYAVVGLGYISQAAVLPAFRHAASNSELTALVSDDPEKLRVLSQRYNVEHTYSYEQYDDCLRSGEIDAVYIAVPNSLHREYTLKAAEAGIHVLCEKPMAVTEPDCQAMIDAARQNNVKLMVAYRLHFEPANLQAIEIAKSGKIGTPRFLISSFSQQVKEGDIRLRQDLGGGSVYDMGVYCINAARYLFRDEPREVVAFSASSGEPRFRGVDEMTAALLRFPDDRLASFVSSLGAADTSYLRIVGTEGELALEPAFEFSTGLRYTLTINGKSQTRKFPKMDQFAPELLYFSECILTDKEPEPSGQEGLADVRVVQALYRSALSHQPVSLKPMTLAQRPDRDQEIRRPPIRKMPELVRAAPPSVKS